MTKGFFLERYAYGIKKKKKFWILASERQSKICNIINLLCRLSVSILCFPDSQLPRSVSVAGSLLAGYGRWTRWQIGKTAGEKTAIRTRAWCERKRMVS